MLKFCYSVQNDGNTKLNNIIQGVDTWKKYLQKTSATYAFSVTAPTVKRLLRRQCFILRKAQTVSAIPRTETPFAIMIPKKSSADFLFPRLLLRLIIKAQR